MQNLVDMALEGRCAGHGEDRCDGRFDHLMNVFVLYVEHTWQRASGSGVGLEGSIELALHGSGACISGGAQR